MTNAMRAAASRLTAGGLAVIVLAGVLGTTLVGCATTGPTASADVATPSDDNDVRKRARIRLELASSYFAEGKTEVALDELKQVLAVDPTFPDAWNLRGLIYTGLGDNRTAEDSFRRALALNPRDPDTAHNYGWMLCQEKRYQEAEQSFQQALASPLYPNRSRTYLAMGVCQARAGRAEEAEATLKRAYELEPGNPVTGYNLARVLFQKGDYERARFYIRRLNNSELANAESLWLGIKVENRLNDPLAVSQLGEQLRKRYPQSPQRASLERKAFDE